MSALGDSGSRDDAGQFSWVGGRPCFDFTNTASWPRDGDGSGERLSDYGQLVAWGLRAGVIDAGTARALRDYAARHPVAARRSLERAIDLRAAIHALFDALAHRRAPSAPAIDAFNAHLHEALAHLEVSAHTAHMDWEWRGSASQLDRIAWPIAWSAATVLTSPDVQWVRACASDGCGWLFLDESRNRRRRWCDMRDCGNRAKARRYYARRRGSEANP